MPLPQEDAPWNFYRLGPAKEKELFKRRRSTYNGVAISAHLASYYQKFCLEFIGSLQKPYFIDPVTHLFAAHPSALRRFLKHTETKRTLRDAFGKKVKGDIKRSYRKLIDQYGEMIVRVVSEEREIRLSDFENESEVNEFVAKVCQFQTNSLSELPAKYQKYKKYAAAAVSGQAGEPNHPMFVIPPYFPITSPKWLRVNLMLIKKAKKHAKGLPIFPVILGRVDQLEVLSTSITTGLAPLETDGFLIWGDGFSGSQSISDLTAYKKIILALSNDGSPVISLYGDALSLVLYYHGLSGFTCGICYGEKRLADQDMDVEGMIPPYYYISAIKKKIQLETELRRVNMAKYPGLNCDCDICESADDLCALTDNETREHFMLSRALELEEIRDGLTKAQMKNQLQTAYTDYKNIGPFSPLSHLANWANLL